MPARRTLVSIAWGVVAALVILLLVTRCGASGPELEPWHTERLSEEFTRGTDIEDFDGYLELEDALFRELDQTIYQQTGDGAGQVLNRYSAGSLADPRDEQPDWNRSFVLPGDGAGGVLLLHGMSDSPYSLRALGLELNRQGYHVIGLRLPGHGTAPSGLKYVDWQDMAAATELAVRQLLSDAEGDRLHIIGYSTGASLALDYALKALVDSGLPAPASLVLISPAIRIHGSARLAAPKNLLSALPGLERMAWLGVMDEFDPYKYNSFATNAGAQVHRVTTDVDQRLSSLSGSPEKIAAFPPVLVLKSTVDATVTTSAVVDNLLNRIPNQKNELVLFDINRQEMIETTVLVADPAPLTNRLLTETDLPFAVTFITNEHAQTPAVVARFKPPLSAEFSDSRPLNQSWPREVVSLSHVALTFPPDDPLYGVMLPKRDDFIYLGDLALRGERGLLKIPESWLLRMRYNPFYDYLEQRTIDWLAAVSE